MKKLFNIAFLIAVFTGVMSCKNEADPQADKSFFTRFYDNSNFNITYIPLDVVQASDGGYIVMAIKRTIVSDGNDVTAGQIYIMKTDEFGTFVSHTEVPEEMTIPAPQLMDAGGKFYFFCMNANYSIQLMEVDNNGGVGEPLNVGGSYPLAAGVDSPTSLMLLSYDQGNRETVMQTISTTTGSPTKSMSFNIGPSDADFTPESPIMDHLLRTGRRLPFFVGKASNSLYYFNGIYQYTLSTVFTDLTDENPLSVIQGTHDDGGFSALQPVSANKFAAARFNFGDNYFLPSTSLVTAGPPSGTANLGGFFFPELAPNAPVTIMTAKVNGNDRILYGSNTRGKQIALFGYNPADGSFAGSRYIGFSNSFELVSMKPTSDNGLIVLGTTYIAGRFPRICLFKLSAEELGKSFK